MKIILDTDIGTDIDDAFALLYLLKKRADLAGVTTVFRNAKRRAKLCKAIAHSMQIPALQVYAGIDKPFVQEPEKIEPPQCKQDYDAEGNYIPPQCSDKFEVYEIPQTNATEFIIKTCRKAEKTEILSIGALTNVATAIRIAPDIVPKIRLTMMGGCFKKLSLGGEAEHEVAEWNILCDPEAAHIVFSSGMEIRMVGLDVTLDCTLSKENFEKIRELKVCPVLNELMQKWAAYYQRELPVLFDPVAAVSIFTDCLTFKKKKMRIGLSGKRRGVTYETRSGYNVEVAVERDDKKFCEEFFSVLQK